MDTDKSVASWRRVMVSEFGEDPMQAIAECTHIEAMQPPAMAERQPTDVLIEVKSASVGWVDLLMTSGQYQHMPSPPYCPGLECSGVVSWVGAEVSSVSLGDRVLVDGFLVGPRSSGDYRAYGGFASLVLAPEAAVYPIPGGLSFDQACNLLGNYETAYHCLIARGRLRTDETVLIHGASGSTGLAAVQVAKIMGAKVIATGRSDRKLDVVAEQGADHVINTSGEGGGVARFRDQVKELTAGRGVDVVYDGVGGAISLESLRCVRFGARYLIVGWAATPFVARGRGKRGAPNANQLPTNLIMMKGLDVLGCPTVISTVNDPKLRAPRLEAVMGWAHAAQLKPYVSHTFSLEDYREAMQAKWNGDVIGGCVLHLG